LNHSHAENKIYSLGAIPLLLLVTSISERSNCAGYSLKIGTMFDYPLMDVMLYLLT